MKVIVTGGAGFIGSHLAEKLANSGHTVTILDNLSTGRLENINSFIEKVNFREVDISVRGDWMKEIEEADVVYHLASLADIVPSIESPVEYFNANVLSTLNIMEAAKEKNTRVVYSASSSCYGIAKEYPTKESSEINPEYPYAFTKRVGEELVLHWGKVYNIPTVSIRFFNVYGTRSRTSGTYGAVMGVFLAQKLANKPLTIVGDGEQSRDFTYVSDIVDGLTLAGESTLVNEIINLGSGATNTINRLAELIGGERIYIPKRPGEPDITHADITKATNILGYSPKISLEQGIKKVMKDINYWKSAPVWTEDTIAKATATWFERLG